MFTVYLSILINSMRCRITIYFKNTNFFVLKMSLLIIFAKISLYFRPIYFVYINIYLYIFLLDVVNLQILFIFLNISE